MGNLIKSINIYLALFGLTLDCDPKECREFNRLAIVDKEGKNVGSVIFVSENKYEINMSLEKYGSIKCKIKVEPIIKDKEKKSYSFSYDIKDISSFEYDLIHGNLWVNESHRNKTNGFDVGGYMSLLKNNKKVAFFSASALKCAYEADITEKKLSFDKTGPNSYRFVLKNPEENNVCIIGPGDKSTFSNDTEYFNRQNHPTIVAMGGKPTFSFKSNAPIPIAREERIIPRIFGHVKEMQYKPSVEEIISKMRSLTTNGSFNFFDNLMSLSFNDFTTSTVFLSFQDEDLETMFSGNPKNKLGVPNIDADGTVYFNSTQKTISKE